MSPLTELIGSAKAYGWSAVLSPSLPLSFESIATTTVGSGGSSSVSFTSIPSTYTHLQIRALGRTTGNSRRLKVQFNSDTTATNYRQHGLYGDGSAAYAETANNNNILYFPESAYQANVFGVGIVDILDYTNTNKYTTLRILHGHDDNGSGYIFLSSCLWMNTNAITSITIVPDNANIAQYSHFALYGVKGE